MFIFAIIFGCLIGFAFAYMLTAKLVASSNDHGDSRNNFKDFADYPLHIIEKKNNLNSPYSPHDANGNAFQNFVNSPIAMMDYQMNSRR